MSLRASVGALVIWVVIVSGVGAAAAAPFAYLVDANSNSVWVIDTAFASITAVVPVSNVLGGVAVLPNGTRAYITTLNGVAVLDAATNTVIATVGGFANYRGIAASPDGSAVYVVDTLGGIVSVIDTATNTVTGTIGVGNSPWGIAVSTGGSRLYVANRGDNTVSVVNPATKAVVATVPVGFTPMGVAYQSTSARVFVTNNGTNTVSVISARTNQVVATLTVGNAPFGVATDPDGTDSVWVANSADNTVSRLSAGNLNVIDTVPVGNNPVGVGLTLGGRLLYVVNSLGVQLPNGNFSPGTLTILEAIIQGYPTLFVAPIGAGGPGGGLFTYTQFIGLDHEIGSRRPGHR